MLYNQRRRWHHSLFVTAGRKDGKKVETFNGRDSFEIRKEGFFYSFFYVFQMDFLIGHLARW